MHIDISVVKARGKVYKRILLRTSYREGKAVKHKTIANLTGQSEETIEAIRFALKNKEEIQNLLLQNSAQNLVQGMAVGAVYVLHQVAKKIGIDECLGKSREGRLALWQIIARVVAQGSRLSAVRLAQDHAVCDLLGLDAFNEDDLYDNLDWLTTHQSRIEQKLFALKNIDGGTKLFLYDVTSSYLEGELNEYGSYGYNRDKKKGKKQIVIGLLTDSEGDPITVQVFPGNTTDGATFIEQVDRAAERFKVSDVIWVGDRGMIKKPQIDSLSEGMKFITAITKPQIQKLIKSGKIHLGAFSDKMMEIIDGEIRYILRRNPIRAEEIASQRQSKLRSLNRVINSKNLYLQKHPKASLDKALSSMRSEARKLNIAKWVILNSEARTIKAEIDEAVLQKESELDGCYAIKTDLASSREANAKIIHDRYKDLSEVERAFRTMKTAHLEVRPQYVRKESRTDGHVFVVMLAYKLVRYLREAWRELEVTVEEGIHRLAGIRGVFREEQRHCQYIPKQEEMAKLLLEALGLRLPEVISHNGVVVATRKSLKNER
jgi:transposase